MDGTAQAITDNIPDIVHMEDLTQNTHTYTIALYACHFKKLAM